VTELRPTSTMPEGAKALLKLALAAKDRAYAPYSKFTVGCALKDAKGALYTGSNVENASYGATICAERSAIVQMASNGGREIAELVLVTSSADVFFPCGMCLQVIQEFCRDLEVIAVEVTGQKYRSARLSELYPSAFTRDRWKHE
jgi:cytidine deaminase